MRFFEQSTVLILLILSAGCGQTQTLPPEALPNGVEGSSYSHTLTVSGVNPHYWSLSSGGLPGGLALEEGTGSITGEPTTAGNFEFTISAESGIPTSMTSYFQATLTIIERLTLDPLLSNAQVSVAYQYELDITGGVEPYGIEVIGLPAGLEFDESEEVISGTPIHEYLGTPLEITVNDSGTPQQTVTAQVSLRIIPQPVVITNQEELTDGTVGTTYSVQLEATGGSQPFTWAVDEGILPAGLRLDLDSGEISGIPTQDGVYEFTIKATDSYSPSNTDSQEFTIEIL